MSCRDRDTEQLHQQLTAAGIDTAYRERNLRFSIHLFNTSDEIDHALSELQH
jgi:cysteine sulfinate desulfinase/cysteine desulfurase-like protein